MSAFGASDCSRTRGVYALKPAGVLVPATGALGTRLPPTAAAGVSAASTGAGKMSPRESQCLVTDAGGESVCIAPNLYVPIVASTELDQQVSGRPGGVDKRVWDPFMSTG